MESWAAEKSLHADGPADSGKMQGFRFSRKGEVMKTAKIVSTDLLTVLTLPTERGIKVIPADSEDELCQRPRVEARQHENAI
jgi:hypothetical protein